MEYKNEKLESFERNLKEQKVAVIGLGVSNIPLIEYLYQKQAKYQNSTDHFLCVCLPSIFQNQMVLYFE